MLTKTKTTSTVGLDVEAGSVAATQVGANGGAGIAAHGVAPLPPGAVREGEVTDPEALGEALKSLFAQRKLSKEVRWGVANNRVAVRPMRLPLIEDEGELETAIRFQAQEHIPMPLDQAVLDWQVVGNLQGENGERQIEVVAVAARRDMLDGAMEAMRRAGLRPVGIDHSAFGMIRALATSADPVPAPADDQTAEMTPPGMPGPVAARMYCSLGDVTNLAVARGRTCLFTRIAPFGVEGIAQRLAERRELSLDHARQWLAHVGLEADAEAIEGDAETIKVAREALTEGATRLADELRRSLEFYGAQEGAVAVEGIVACGAGSTIPGLAAELERELGQRVEVGRPAALAGLDDGSAARLTLSYGLALAE